MRPDAGRRVPEKIVQAQIVRLLRTVGARVYVLGHPSPSDGRRHHGTMQTPGLADLEVFLPAQTFPGRDRDTRMDGRLLKIEVKASGGCLSPAQRRYQQFCLAAQVEYLTGDLDEVVFWLERYGFLRSSGPWQRVKRSC